MEDCDCNWALLIGGCPLEEASEHCSLCFEYHPLSHDIFCYDLGLYLILMISWVKYITNWVGYKILLGILHRCNRLGESKYIFESYFVKYRVFSYRKPVRDSRKVQMQFLINWWSILKKWKRFIFIIGLSIKTSLGFYTGVTGKENQVNLLSLIFQIFCV